MAVRSPWRVAAPLLTAVMLLTSFTSGAAAVPAAPLAPGDATPAVGAPAETPDEAPGTAALARNSWAFTLHPQDQSLAPGYEVEFTAVFETTDTATWIGYWERSTDGGGTWISETRPALWHSGSTQTLRLGAAMAEMDGFLYRARVMNEIYTPHEDRVSEPARLTVLPASAQFIEQPQDVVVREGDTAELTAAYTVSPIGRGGRTTEISRDGGRTWQEVAWGAWTSTAEQQASGLYFTPRWSQQFWSSDDGLLMRFAITFDGQHLAYSDAAEVTVEMVPPVVTEAPADVTVMEGESASFSAAYGGTDAPTSVQWQFSTDGGRTFDDVPDGIGPNGAGSIPLVIDSVHEEMDGWQYRVRFTNEAGSAFSEVATLRVGIWWPETSLEAALGVRVDLSVSDMPRSRDGALHLTAPPGTRINGWRIHHVSGITESLQFTISPDGRTMTTRDPEIDDFPWGGGLRLATFTLQVDPDVAPGTVLDGGEFRVVQGGVLRARGAVTVTVPGTAPRVTEHPTDAAVFLGEPVPLRVAAEGTEPFTVDWQWRTGPDGAWQPWDGGTDADQPHWAVEVTLDDLAHDGRQYRAVVRNAWGSDASEPATVSVRQVRRAQLSITPQAVLVDALPGAR